MHIQNGHKLGLLFFWLDLKPMVMGLGDFTMDPEGSMVSRCGDLLFRMSAIYDAGVVPNMRVSTRDVGPKDVGNVSIVRPFLDTSIGGFDACSALSYVVSADNPRIASIHCDVTVDLDTRTLCVGYLCADRDLKPMSGRLGVAGTDADRYLTIQDVRVTPTFIPTKSRNIANV